MLTGAVFSGLWLALIGWMLGQSARVTVAQSNLNKRLGGLTVSDVMDDEPVAIPFDATVEEALDEYFLRYRGPGSRSSTPAGASSASSTAAPPTRSRR